MTSSRSAPRWAATSRSRWRGSLPSAFAGSCSPARDRTPTPPERRAGRAGTIELVETEGPPGLWENQRDKLFGEHAPEAAVELARTMALSRQVPDLVRAIEAIRDRPDSTGVLQATPVVLAVGAGDLFFPLEEARAFAEQTQSGRLVVFDRSRHLPSLEQPADFNQTLLELLSSAG